MAKPETKYLVGLIGPEVLSAIEADGMHPVFLDISACNALEIRYDFFKEKDWPGLSARVRKIAPHAIQIGTIRLERDGGKYPDRLAHSRLPLWSEILKAPEVPEWLDLEHDCLQALRDLKNLADLRKVRIIASQHNFLRIPNQPELADFARDFELFAAFGMGETGIASRIWSLKAGANLTYASIGKAQAPGQVEVAKMERAFKELENLDSPQKALEIIQKL